MPLGRAQRLGLVPGRRPDRQHDDGLARRPTRPPADRDQLPLAALPDADHLDHRPDLPAGDACASSCSRFSSSARSRCSASTGSPRTSAGGSSGTGPRSVGRRAVRGYPAVRRPLPREVDRAVPAAGARAHGDARLPVDGARARSPPCFVVRSLGDGPATDALLAGLVAGAAGGLKPPNLLFAAGAVLAYVVARRWREAARFGSALVPRSSSWRSGRTRASASSRPSRRKRCGSRRSSVALSVDLDRYLELDFDHWRRQMDHLREFFWSARVAQWAPVAGLLAVLRVRRVRRSRRCSRAGSAAFLVVKGFSPRADIEANTFWRLLMPAWPAYLLLFASIPLLVPTFARRLGDRLCTADRRRSLARWIAVAAVATVLVPAAAIAASSPLEPPRLQHSSRTRGTATILTPSTRRRARRRRRDGGGNRAHVDGRRCLASRCLLPRLPLGRPGPTPCAQPDGQRVLELLPERRSRSDDARPDLPRPVAPADERPIAWASARTGPTTPTQGDVFVLSPAARGDPVTRPLTRSSSSAIRCASSTFSSVSFEITVE